MYKKEKNQRKAQREKVVLALRKSKVQLFLLLLYLLILCIKMEARYCILKKL